MTVKLAARLDCVRAAEEISLKEVDTHLAQRVMVVFRLDPFGDDGCAEVPREIHD